MTEDRLAVRLDIARQAVIRLAEAAALPEDSITRDATIKRFEFSWEAVWKCMQTHAQFQGFEGAGPRQAIRHAFTTGIVATPEAADAWFRMLDDRNRTTHLYDESSSQEVYEHIRDEYVVMLGTMVETLRRALGS